jgi:tetratricopeptide (TPR) repeat protein
MSHFNFDVNREPEIPVSRIEFLERAIEERRITEGIAEMNGLYTEFLPELSPRLRNSCRFLALTAIWCDTGFGGIDALRLAFNRFGKTDARSLSAEDAVYQQVGLGVYAFLTGKFEQAQGCFRRAWDGMADGVAAGEFYQNLILFYQARIYRKYGAYPDSFKKTEEAEQMAENRGKPLLGAVIRATRAWLLWQRGDLQAPALLEKCRHALEETDDQLAKSAIASMAGRMARRLPGGRCARDGGALWRVRLRSPPSYLCSVSDQCGGVQAIASARTGA